MGRAIGQLGAEHDLVARRVRGGEQHVCDSRLAQTTRRVVVGCDRPPKLLAQQPESVFGDRRQQGFSGLEVSVGSGGGHTGPPGRRPQR